MGRESGEFRLATPPKSPFPRTKSVCVKWGTRRYCYGRIDKLVVGVESRETYPPNPRKYSAPHVRVWRADRMQPFTFVCVWGGRVDGLVVLGSGLYRDVGRNLLLVGEPGQHSSLHSPNHLFPLSLNVCVSRGRTSIY